MRENESMFVITQKTWCANSDVQQRGTSNVKELKDKLGNDLEIR